MADEQAQSGMITVGQVAKILMVSEERVRQLVKLGYIPRATKGQYVWIAAVQGYIRFLKEEDRRSSKSASASRLQDAKVAEAEMRMAEKRRELVSVEEATIALDIVMAKVRDEFTGLPARVTRDMDLRRKLEAEANGSLNRIADSLTASAEFIEKGGDLPSGWSADDT